MQINRSTLAVPWKSHSLHWGQSCGRGLISLRSRGWSPHENHFATPRTTEKIIMGFDSIFRFSSQFHRLIVLKVSLILCFPDLASQALCILFPCMNVEGDIPTGLLSSDLGHYLQSAILGYQFLFTQFLHSNKPEVTICAIESILWVAVPLETSIQILSKFWIQLLQWQTFENPSHPQTPAPSWEHSRWGALRQRPGMWRPLRRCAEARWICSPGKCWRGSCCLLCHWGTPAKHIKLVHARHISSTKATLREAHCPPRKNSSLIIFSPTLNCTGFRHSSNQTYLECACFSLKIINGPPVSELHGPVYDQCY